MAPKRNKKKGDTSFESEVLVQGDHGHLEEIINKLSINMSKLSQVVEGLASNVQIIDKRTRGEHSEINEGNSLKIDEKENLQKNDRSYISNWRELGGGNLVFYPKSKTHPMIFLKKLNKLFEDAGVPHSARCSLAINGLRGAAADWAELKEAIFITFDDFVTAFKDKYWGVEKQRELFLDISYGRFETGSRAEYFMNYVTEAKFLSEAIPMQKLIDMLSRHFPADIRRGIVTNGLSSFEVVEEYLRKIDETYMGERNENMRRNINHNNGNYVNAERIIGNDAYYGFNKDLGAAKATGYKNLGWVAKELLRRVDGDSAIEQYQGWPATIPNQRPIETIINRYVDDRSLVADDEDDDNLSPAAQALLDAINNMRARFNGEEEDEADDDGENDDEGGNDNN